VSHAYTTVLPATIQSIRRSWEEQKAITEILHYNHMAEDRPRRRLHRGRTDRPRKASRAGSLDTAVGAWCHAPTAKGHDDGQHDVRMCTVRGDRPGRKITMALMVDSGTVRHEREEIEQAVPYVDALLRNVRIRTFREEGWTVIRRKRRR
jgi:hypothetical protein